MTFIETIPEDDAEGRRRTGTPPTASGSATRLS